jgi:hypothetical protein
MLFASVSAIYGCMEQGFIHTQIYTQLGNNFLLVMRPES